MKNRRIWVAMAVIGVVIARMAVPSKVSAADGGPIVVVVNNSNPIENLSVADLRKIFLSDRSRWDTGKAVAPVIVAAGSPERSAFLKIVCSMSDAEFNKYFVVSSSRDVKTAVAASPGAIGFVRALDFHGDGSDGGVKAIKVDGMAASDSGYKLKM